MSSCINGVIAQPQSFNLKMNPAPAVHLQPRNFDPLLLDLSRIQTEKFGLRGRDLARTALFVKFS